MVRCPVRWFLLACLAVVSRFCGGFVAGIISQVDFARDVEPILHRNCYACHGPSVQMNGLRLDQRAAAFEGGHSGKAIVPSDSEASLLMRRVSSADAKLNMPPGDVRLSDGEIGVLRAWVDQGAEWPEKAEPIETKPSDAAKHWSFQPVRRPEPPEVSQRTWVRNPIDRFVLAKLEAEGIRPSVEADKLTLLRRLHFDLIGLPPGPGEIGEFLLDNAPGAYEAARRPAARLAPLRREMGPELARFGSLRR